MPPKPFKRGGKKRPKRMPPSRMRELKERLVRMNGAELVRELEQRRLLNAELERAIISEGVTGLSPATRAWIIRGIISYDRERYGFNEYYK